MITPLVDPMVFIEKVWSGWIAPPVEGSPVVSSRLPTSNTALLRGQYAARAL